MALNPLNNAKISKNDEYFTLIEDIGGEVAAHAECFRGKRVYCNCDGEKSNFFRFFVENFQELGIQKLVCTEYNPNGRGRVWNVDCPTTVQMEDLEGDGSFDSKECKALLEHSDIVVTNPPFSLFREYMAMLAASGKCFLVIGNINAAACQSVFSEIAAGRLWFGINWVKEFQTPEGDTKKFGNTLWYTNIDHGERHKWIEFNSQYDEKVYPRYFTHDAIEVGRATDIPADYEGAMGVPITFLPKMSPEQFELLGCCEPALELEYYKQFPCFRGEYKSRQIRVNGKLCQKVYHRALIKAKQPPSSTSSYEDKKNN